MRAKQSIKNFVTGTASTAISMVASMIATPYVLKWLGVESYGLYRVVYDWLGYLTLAELGLTDALVPLFSKSISDPDPAKTLSALIGSIKAFIKVLPWKALAGLALVYFVPKLVHVNGELARQVRVACLIGITSSFLCVVFPFRVLIESRQLGSYVSNLVSIQSLCTMVFSLVFAYFNFGVWGQFLALLLGSLPFYLSLIFMINRLFPGVLFKIWGARSEPTVDRHIRELKGPMIVMGICSKLSLSSDTIIIASMINPVAVTSFFITQRLIMVLQGQLYNIGNSTWAAMMDLHYRGEKENFSKKLIELTKLVTTAGVVVLGPVTIYNADFVSLWVGKPQFGGMLLTLVSTLNALFLAAIALWSWIFTATGNVKIILPQYILFTAINFGSSVIFTHFLGLPGPAMGTTMACLTTTLLIIPRKLESHYAVSATGLYLAMLEPVLKLLPLLVIIGTVARFIPAQNWVTLILSLGVSAFLLGATSWLSILNAEERFVWKRRLGFIR